MAPKVFNGRNVSRAGFREWTGGQVIIESATLSGTGAFLGVLVGIGLTWLVAAVSPMRAVVAPRWVALGVFMGVAVGMIAGVYPAARAARLNPVDALRYE